MLIDEIRAGESANIEFKVEVPKKSEKYIKSVIAFANTAGGKIIIGVDDKTHEIIGVDKNEVFKIIDNITNTISDMCYPQIFPSIEVDTIEEKSVVVIEVYPGACRPYYMKSKGKEEGTYIRVSGTSRPADEAILKDLELQGSHNSFDEMICVEQKYDEDQAKQLCHAIKKYMIESSKTVSEKENIKDVSIQNLINWGVIKNLDGTLVPTNAFVLLTNNTFPFAKIQCALFKGTERVVFIDKRDFDGPLYKQIEEAYEFVLKHINLGSEINGLSSPKSSLKSSPKSSLKEVNQTQEKIIKMILNNPKITQITMAEQLEITLRAVKKSIKELNEKGILKRIGSARGGYWEVDEKEK